MHFSSPRTDLQRSRHAYETMESKYNDINVLYTQLVQRRRTETATQVGAEKTT
jgi:hypothetical protein